MIESLRKVQVDIEWVSNIMENLNKEIEAIDNYINFYGKYCEDMTKKVDIRDEINKNRNYLYYPIIISMYGLVERYLKEIGKSYIRKVYDEIDKNSNEYNNIAFDNLNHILEYSKKNIGYHGINGDLNCEDLKKEVILAVSTEKNLSLNEELFGFLFMNANSCKVKDFFTNSLKIGSYDFVKKESSYTREYIRVCHPELKEDELRKRSSIIEFKEIDNLTNMRHEIAHSGIISEKLSTYDLSNYLKMIKAYIALHCDIALYAYFDKIVQFGSNCYAKVEYKFCGEEKKNDNVIIFKVPTEKIQKNDVFLGYRDGYKTYDILSIQVDDNEVEEALYDQLVGVKLGVRISKNTNLFLSKYTKK